MESYESVFYSGNQGISLFIWDRRKGNHISSERQFTGISEVSELVTTHEMADYKIKDTTENLFHNLQVVKTW